MPRSERGSALVELALTLPLLLALFVGAVDFGRLFYTAMELTNAARAGAQFGSTNIGNTTPASAIETVATSSVNLTGITATATGPDCNCYDDGGTFVSNVSCTTPVATACTGGSHRVMTITVTTTKTFTTIMNYPGIPTSVGLTRTATMRVSE
jgi:Flp pilus assembly protein TadG